MKKIKFILGWVCRLNDKFFFIRLVLFIITVVALENKMKENIEISSNNKNIIAEKLLESPSSLQIMASKFI
jgi:hypothetical protein